MMQKTLSISWAIVVVGVALLGIPAPIPAQSLPLPFSPGENLVFQVRWENIAAGTIQLQVRSIKRVKGMDAYHFVMTTRTSGLAELVFKIDERIDAYASTQMEHSIYYAKRVAEGQHQREETIEFDWSKGQAQYRNFNKKRDPITIQQGSFDPLSAFYFTRMAIQNEHSRMTRPVTDGKKNFMGRAKVIKRETITLANGQSYDTFCLAPDMGLFGGAFKESKDPSLRIWVTADAKRIPVRIQSKVAVGSFVCELVSATGI